VEFGGKIAAAGLAILLGAASVGTGFAQSTDHGDHGPAMQDPGNGAKAGHAEPAGGHGHAAAGSAAAESAATAAYRAANLAMHRAMDIEFSGDPDLDFARGMVGHHQGALDMARVVLEHGKDPELRRLAEEVIEAQEAEIAFLREWIAEHAD
jgi:uncharacterized protein (DUF305 family)